MQIAQLQRMLLMVHQPGAYKDQAQEAVQQSCEVDTWVPVVLSKTQTCI